jgi:hypothetical protein
LPAAEPDEDGLAELEVSEVRRDKVRVRPVPTPTRGIDRDLDGSRSPSRQSGLVAQRRVELDGLAQGHGDRE